MSQGARRLHPIFNADGQVRAWTCDACEWRCDVQTPRPLSAYGDEALRAVQKIFFAHECESTLKAEQAKQ